MNNKLGILLTMLILSAAIVVANVVFNSPAACSGQWTNCSNAFADNSNRATAQATGSASRSGLWNGYGFSMPSSASIDKVIVRADFYASKSTGYLKLQASDDGGSSFGSAHTIGGNTAEQTFLIDVTSDRSWTPAKLNDANLRINATCFKSGNGPNPTCSLDWVPVEVTYTLFDFNLAASPSSAVIFQTQTAQSTINVTRLGGAPQTVSLSYSNCPVASTCSLNPASGTTDFASSLSVATTNMTTPGYYAVNVTGVGDGLTRITTFTVHVV